MNTILIPVSQIRGYGSYSAETDALVENIRKNGLKNPLRVIYDQAKDCYFISDGSHRFWALKQLGWTEIPCKVLEISNQHSPHP